MKKSLLSFLFLAVLAAYATGQTLIGINSRTGSTQLIRYNLAADVITDSFPITDWRGVLASTSTYDAQTSSYIFNTLNRGIVSMNALSGSSRILANNPLIESHYDQSDGRLHGLQRVSSTDNNIALLSFDTLSMTPTKTTIIPDLNGVLLGSSAFNSNNHEFIFIGGKNVAGTPISYKLYFVNVKTGVVRRATPIDFSIIGTQFDNVNNQYVGIHRLNGSTQSSFAKIDTNGTIKSLQALNDVKGFLAGGSTICQTERMYITSIKDNSFMDKILSINLNDGAETRSAWPQSRGTFLEFECDNTQFAFAKYGQFVSTKVINSENLLAKAYPNPSNDGQIYVEIPPQYKGFSMQLFNQLGQLVSHKTVEGTQTQLNVNQAGIYLLKLTADDKRTAMKITINN
jgi:hypothetical protein